MNRLCVEAPFCAIVPFTMGTEPLPEATEETGLVHIGFRCDCDGD